MSGVSSYSNDEAPRPYFFLSYAHTPRSAAPGSGDPNYWVNQFYQDLCAHILELTDLADDENLGFIDRGMHLGEGWSQRISEALAGCRVFVPLFSRRYFRSLACGQEWSTFAGRRVYSLTRTANHATGIVPVLWSPVADAELPTVAGQLQFKHSDFGQEYETEGLAALRRLNYYRDAYDLAVYRLAKRIVHVAEQTMIVPGHVRDFQSGSSCFDTPPRTRELRISVLACEREDLPEERSTEWYGSSPRDWWPYPERPSENGLADHAARIARQLDFHPSVHDFAEEGEEVLRSSTPDAPGLLLLDRWALLDPVRRELARRFDQHDASWISLMEPWSRDDPECLAVNGKLRALVDETLQRKRRGAKPTFRAPADGLPTLESFEEELPRAAQRAMYAFADRVRPAQPPGKGPRSRRPSLRGDPDPPPQWPDPQGSSRDAGPDDEGTSR